MSSTDCLDKCSKDCFSVLDTPNTEHQLRMKGSSCITWLKPILNKQNAINTLRHFLSKFVFFCSFPISFGFTVCLIYLVAVCNCFYT